MLERNISALVASGFRHIFVAFNAIETEIESWLHRRGIPLARAHGATLECLKETKQLGNIGIARELRDHAESVLVTFVDNLTTIDLSAMMRVHRHCGAALTLASHREPFHIPFGELGVDSAGYVTDYSEKPVHYIRISSGTYVLDGKRACAAIPPEQPLGAAGLFHLLHGRGERIAAYDHDAAWIDINDMATISRAEHLVAGHAAQFELCHTKRPDHCLVNLALCTEGHVLAERRGGSATRYPGLWDLPGEHLPCGGDRYRLDDNPSTLFKAAQSVASHLLGGDAAVANITSAGSFDDLEIDEGCLTRHHVFVLSLNALRAAWPLSDAVVREETPSRCWLNLREAIEAHDQWVSPVLVRAAAHVRLRGITG